MKDTTGHNVNRSFSRRGAPAVLALSLFATPLPTLAASCGIGLLATIGQAVPGLNQKKVPDLISNWHSNSTLAEYQSLADQAASEADLLQRGYSRTNIVPMPRTRGEIQKMLDRLEAGWPGEIPAYKVGITSQLNYSAMVTQDKHMLLPIGLIELSQSDDELAFTLAHELAHVILGHGRQLGVQRKRLRDIRGFKGKLKNAISATAIEIDDGQAVNLVDKEKVAKLNSQISTHHRRVQRTLRDLIHPKWSKKHEDEADLLGMELLLRAGYSPDGVSDAIERINELRARGCAAFQRVGSDIKAFMQDQMLPTMEQIEQKDVDTWFDDLIDRVRRFAKRKVEKVLVQQALPSTHRSQTKRLKYIWKFADRPSMSRLLDSANDIEPTDTVVSRIHESSEFKAALKSAFAMPRVEDNLAAGDTSEAWNHLQHVNMDVQQGRILKYQWRQAQGSPKAIGNLRIALGAERPAVQTVEFFALEAFGQNQPDQVKTALDAVERIYDDKEYFLPERIYYTVSATRDEDAADALLKRCMDSGHGFLEGPCIAARLGKSPDFRANYERILASVACKTDGDAGGDVECEQTTSRAAKVTSSIGDFFKKLEKDLAEL